MRGFLLDLNRCTGCQACMLACNLENQLDAASSWRRVYNSNPGRRPGVSTFHLSIGCLHCAEAACMRVCPASAYSRDALTGAVLVNPELCIGCRCCGWACPFDAPLYDRRAGTMSKCNFCNDRLHAGADPACATLCPTGALRVMDLQEYPADGNIPGLPATELGPSARFIPPRSPAGPELTATEIQSPDEMPDYPHDSGPPPKVSVESDWSLIFFSVAAALLVAIAADSIAGSRRVHGYDFLLAALGTMAVSLLHLGRRRRAWRAVLNVRHSWLSREIFFYTAFVGLATWMLLSPRIAPYLAWPAILAGYAALFSMDQVYESLSSNPWIRLHSARVLLSSLFLFGILSMNEWVAGAAGLMKLVLYSYRQPWFQGKFRAVASVLRLGLGFVVPLALWRAYPEWILPSVLVAEVIDRCEYYLDLNVVGIGHTTQR